MPIAVDGDRISIDEYWQSWDADRIRLVAFDERAVDLSLHSRTKGETATVHMNVDDGDRIRIAGIHTKSSGYASIAIRSLDGA